jgi:hypothetical protein
MNNKSRFLFLTVLITIAIVACNQTTKIPVKAALVYKMGGAQPVTRTKLYLLKEEAKKAENASLFTSPAIAQALEQGEEYAGIHEDRIKDYIVATTTTDFEGNAEFKDIPPGKYYIAGYTRTRSQYGYVVWKLEVNAKNGMETIFLDQNNALDTDN